MCHPYIFTSESQQDKSVECMRGSTGEQAACTPPGIPQQHSGGYKLKPSSSATSGKALFFRKKNLVSSSASRISLRDDTTGSWSFSISGKRLPARSIRSERRTGVRNFSSRPSSSSFPLQGGQKPLGKPCRGALEQAEGACCQEQATQPYLVADVTCNLIETGRLVRDLPVGQGVATTCCLSLGQGVVGSQGVGCSAFSPDRRGKGQRSCRGGRERQLGGYYNTTALRTQARAPCYRWATTVPSLGRGILPHF